MNLSRSVKCERQKNTMYRGQTCILLWIMLCGVLATLSGCGQIVAKHTLAEQTENGPIAVASTVATPTAVLNNIPARLIVPAIHVNAAIESVGVATNGDLETPTQSPWTDTGWYTAGPLPGERGSAVIDGHLDRPGGYPAVFWNLHLIQTEDLVEVVMLSGKIIRFHVTHVAFYPPQAAPLQEIFGDGGGSYLNLITCAGDWIPAQHQTTLRMVAYTSLG